MHSTTPPILTVVIVNYNVEYFLAQCLHSVRKASAGLAIETIVVDNASADGSVEMVKHLFPEVKLIANKDNVGFSKANNQAMRISNAKYVLLLNPDTFVEETTFKKCIDFMDSHPTAGGLGVKMVDGKGQFLAESKRGLPTPMVAFYKIFGFSSLFPTSKTFGQYHQGHLDKNETHEIDILAGAFMMMRKSVLDEVGLLDEDFFMYGEDIDLSWRIILGGYKNYYYPGTTIIHYKGESTKKSSVNYVLVFYNAMIIFAKKHFSKSNASVFEFFIRLAIYFRAFIALMRRFIEKSILPALDFSMVIIALIFSAKGYEQFTDIQYPKQILQYIFPVYGAIIAGSIFLNKGYSPQPLIGRLVKGVFWGGLISLLLYGLLDESYRFSRFVMIAGAIGSLLLIIGYRTLFQLIGWNAILFKSAPEIRLAIVGKEGGISRVKKVLEKTIISPDMILEVYPSYEFQNHTDHFIANLGQLPECIRVFGINQIIFCSEDIDSTDIIKQMTLQETPGIELKISPPESAFIIGSTNINTSGEILSIHSFNTFLTPETKFAKRILDFLVSIFIFLWSPILLFSQQNKRQFFKNIWATFMGKKTWVGLSPSVDKNNSTSFHKPFVTHIGAPYISQNKPQAFHENLNFEYAKNYNFITDLLIIWQERHSLDN